MKRKKLFFLVIAVTMVSSVLSQFIDAPRLGFAHDNVHVHPFFCEEAARFLPEGSAIRLEIDSYLDDLRYGAKDEDKTDVVWHFNEYLITLQHFWDADAGPDALVQDCCTGVTAADSIGTTHNAFQKSVVLFAMALEEYPTDPIDRSSAYELLGRVAHLIGDMTLPSHVHNDYHPKTYSPWGDDSYEDWYKAAGGGNQYLNWTAESARAQGELIDFPWAIERQLRQGNWESGLFYLMYSTNQRADYFASDDRSGDRVDAQAWMDYTGWPSSPTTKDDLEDNDHDLLGEVDDDDNDADGDLSKIAQYTSPYAIQAIAALYRMFYERIHPPTASIEIDYADQNADGDADYRWVSLDLSYDSGAPQYSQDLEARFANEDLVWSDWEPVTRRRSWVLSAGDGTKTVFFEVRNLMGLSTTETSSVQLKESALPQVFLYRFSATGPRSITAVVDFYIREVHVLQKCGDGDECELYLKSFVDDGVTGAALSGKERVPWDPVYFKIGPKTNYGQGHGRVDLTQVDPAALGCSSGCVIEGGNDYSHAVRISTIAGQTVRLQTRGWDSDWPSDDDDLGYIWTDTYTVPEAEGTYTLAHGWFSTAGNGGTNEYFALRVEVVATVTEVPWAAADKSQESAVNYGEPEKWIADASEALRAPYCREAGHPYDCSICTEWKAEVDNPAVGFRLDGRHLYAWTKDSTPDMVVAALGPVDLMVTDSDGKRIGTATYGHFTDPFEGEFKVDWEVETYQEISGSVVIHSIDINGDGVEDSLVALDSRKLGEYQIQVTPRLGGKAQDTYSIGIVAGIRKNAGIAPYPQPQPVALFVAENAHFGNLPAEPYRIQSTDLGVNLPPSVVLPSGHRGVEGSMIRLDASMSTDPNGDPLKYRWDFDGNGTWDTEWSGGQVVTHTWSDNWTGEARVEISDGVYTDSASTSISILNAAPNIEVAENQSARPGDVVPLAIIVTDPGRDEIRRVSWDFGDGTTAQGGLTQTHVFSEAGIHVVRVTVEDDDGGLGMDSFVVNTGVKISVEQVTSIPRTQCQSLPESTIEYSVAIHNLSRERDIFDLTVYGLDHSSYWLSTNSVEAGPDETTTVVLRLNLSKEMCDANEGFTIVAVSRSGRGIVGDAGGILVFQDVPQSPSYLRVIYVTVVAAAIAAIIVVAIGWIRHRIRR